MATIGNFPSYWYNSTTTANSPIYYQTHIYKYPNQFSLQSTKPKKPTKPKIASQRLEDAIEKYCKLARREVGVLL